MEQAKNQYVTYVRSTSKPSVDKFLTQRPYLLSFKSALQAYAKSQELQNRLDQTSPVTQGMNSMSKDNLQNLARSKGHQVNGMTKQMLINAIEGRNIYSHMNERNLRNRVYHGMVNRNLWTEQGKRNLLQSRPTKKLKRIDMYGIIPKIEQYPLVQRVGKTRSPEPKLGRVGYTQPLRQDPRASAPKFNLRNSNLNISLGNLVNVAIAGRKPNFVGRPTGGIIRGKARANAEELARVSSRAVQKRLMNPEGIVRKTVTPAEYQLRVMNALLGGQRGLIAVHSVGSGKTFTSILTARNLLAKGIVKKVAVITSVTLAGEFLKELIAHGETLENYDIYTYSDIKSKYFDKVPTETRTGTTNICVIKDSAKDKFKNHFVIIDEIHECRNTKTQTYTTIRDITKSARKVLGLTATPIVNQTQDMVALVQIASGANAPFFTVDQFAENYGQYFSFYERSIDDDRFPSFSVIDVEIPMAPSYFNRWNTEGESEFHHIKRQNQTKGERDKLTQLLDAQDDNTKIHWCINKTKKIVKAGGRVIVYSEFVKNGLNRIASQLMAVGIRSNSIHGEVSAADRSKIIIGYNSGKVPVILISGAGAQGIDLKETTAVIIIEPPWHPAGVYQVIGRGVRVNSHIALPKEKQHVNAYLLRAKPLAGANPDLLTDSQMYENYVWTKQDQIIATFKAMGVYSIERQPLSPKFPTRKLYEAQNANNLGTRNLPTLKRLPNKMEHKNEILRALRNVPTIRNMVPKIRTATQLDEALTLAIKIKTKSAA